MFFFEIEFFDKQKLALLEKEGDFLEWTCSDCVKENYLRNWWTTNLQNFVLASRLGKDGLKHKRISLHNQEVSHGFKRKMTASKISEHTVQICSMSLFTYWKIHLNLEMENTNPTIDVSNEVTHWLQLMITTFKLNFKV